MFLSDRDIEQAWSSGEIGIEPFEQSLLQPASYDIRIGNHFKTFATNKYVEVDPKEDTAHLTRDIVVSDDRWFLLRPGEFVLATTIERFWFPKHMVGFLNGKSSLARLGIAVHATAGLFDPGYEGECTLELSNVLGLPVRLHPGMKIAQMTFARLSSPCVTPYGDPALNSKYQGQTGPVASRMHED